MNPAMTRRSGFLANVRDVEYLRLCQYITDHRHLRFPNIHRIIRLSKEDGDVLCTIITHLIAWVNPSPSTPVLVRTDTNKPPLINDLAEYVRPPLPEAIESTLERLNVSLLGCHCQSPEQFTSILLQQDALDFVISHMTAFRSREQKSYLATLPGPPTNQDSRSKYASRFQHPHWNGLLTLVSGYIAVDLLFEPPTTADPNTTDPAKAHENRPFQSALEFQEWVCRSIQDRAKSSSSLLVSDKFRSMLEKWFSDHSRRDSEIPESSRPDVQHGNTEATAIPLSREMPDQLPLVSAAVASPSTASQTLIGSELPEQRTVKRTKATGRRALPNHQDGLTSSASKRSPKDASLDTGALESRIASLRPSTPGSKKIQPSSSDRPSEAAKIGTASTVGVGSVQVVRKKPYQPSWQTKRRAFES